MKIVIVEDRPWKLEESIREIREKKFVLNDLVYVCKNKDVIDKQAETNLANLKKHLDNLQIHIVDNSCFSDEMQNFFDDGEYFILCDFNLTGDNREYFDKRVNVMFAKRIMKKYKLEYPSPRIYFYTTAGETTNAQINAVFPGRNISVVKMNEGQVILDIDEIVTAIKKCEAEK